MNRFIRYTSATVALSVAALSAAAADPGYVDIGKLKPAEGCQFVEVNLGAPLLKFAALFVDRENAEVGSLIRSLKHVRVNVLGYNEDTRDETATRVQTLRRDLEAQGWTQIVTVQQASEAEDVAIYVKMAADDSIDGLVVTVLDADKSEAVIVNVVGNIKPEQVAALGKELHLEPLSQLRIKSRHHGS